ncbi:MAG: hypothetical protein CML23_14500 [Rhizobiaceae bacterium]|nr:hypothetical protein [Rhizobiaceae bacterium]
MLSKGAPRQQQHLCYRLQVRLGKQFELPRLEVASLHLVEVIAEVTDETAELVLDVLELVS